MQIISVALTTMLLLTAHGWNTSQFIAQTNSQNVTLANVDSSYWTADIAIGSPAQNFTVQVDTGSNFLWVPLNTCHFCQLTTRYNPNGQADYKPTGQTYSQAYGSGDVYGLAAYDNVGLVNSSISTNFEMLFATYESGMSSIDNTFDGIMGISNDPSFTNIFQASYASGQISSALYGLALQPITETSYLLFGEIDQQILSKTTWIPSLDNQRWVFGLPTQQLLDITSISFNGQQQTVGSISSGLLDSGTSCLVFEDELYTALIDNFIEKVCTVNSEGEYLCPCNPTQEQQASLPTITFGFTGGSIEVPFYNYLVGYFQPPASGQCPVCLASIPSSEGFFVMGDPVLKSTLLLFNKEENLIGVVSP